MKQMPVASGKQDLFGFMAGEFKIVEDIESTVVPLYGGIGACKKTKSTWKRLARKAGVDFLGRS
jgi:hypothetical protein